ncbi:uncharacterized protein CBL_05665 [Carabus blaptoides fortunei]
MWTREATSILIEEYQANDCMWMTTSPFYRNKQKRTEALVQIALKVSKCRSQTSVEDIKNKINGIRTQYVSEINKLIIAGNRGDVYEPTLWCFDLLSFLKPFTQPKQRALNGSWPRTILPKPYKPSFTANAKPSIHTYSSPPSAARQPSVNAVSDKNCIIIKEENEDDDIELIEEEDTLQTDEDYSNISAYHPEQTLEECHEEQYQPGATKQSSPSTSNLDSGFDETHEQDRFRRLFSPENNPEVTLVPKRDLMKRKTEDATDDVEEKKKKMDEYKVEKRQEDTEDRISIFGKFVISRMRTVTDKVLLMKLEHTIQNAIIDAQLKQTELDEKNTKEDSG